MTHDRAFAYRPALDGLRAFAVLAVVFYHLGYDWAPGGFLGVDTFFVLSGYLITSLLVAEHASSGRVGFAAFWARRARRLLPAVIVLVGTLAATAHAWSDDQRLRSFRGDALATLGYVANWRLILSDQSYFELFNAPSPLRHMWSLAIEEQFYVVWPVLVALALAIAGGRRRGLAALCVGGAVVSTVLMALRFEEVDPSRVYYGTDTRAHMLLVGAIVALVLERWAPSSGRGRGTLQVLGTVGAVALLGAVVLVDDHDAFMYHGGFLAYAAVVGVVIAAAVQTSASPLRGLLSWRPLRWIGMISYGLYLWHWPVQVIATRGRVGIDGVALDVFRIAVTFAVSIASYYVIERPIRYGRLPSRAVLGFAPVAIALAGLVVVTGTAGANPTPPAFDTGAPITPPPPPPPTTAPRVTTTTRAGTPVEPKVVAVVGDSVATTISWGLDDVVAARGGRLVLNAFPGCGIANGLAVDDRGELFDWSEACAESIPGAQAQMVRDHDPDVVVWLSTWDLADQLVDGEVLHAGTPEHDRVLLASMREAAQRLTSGGARLALLTVVPRSASDFADADDDGDGATRHYNGLLRRFERENPDLPVDVVDLLEWLCPDGPPCPDEVDGVRLRPDGAHFTEETAPWIAQRLYPRLVEVLNSPR